MSNNDPRFEPLKEWLRPLEDPEMLISLVELGLIYSADFVDLEEGMKIDLRMTLTTPSCPAAGYLVDQVQKRVLEFEASGKKVVDASVALVWEPKWDPKTMASEECKEKMGLW